MKRIAVILGTRPEAIKLAPVILELAASRRADPIIVNTGQHADLAAEALRALGLSADVDLAVMAPDQSLGELAGRLHARLDAFLAKARPDAVLVQGDTMTAMVGALASFYRRIPIGHVEAGLRTFDRKAPFPEEINRTFIGHLADLHFAPTARARANLLAAGAADADVSVTGNTVVDAIRLLRPGAAVGAQPSSRLAAALAAHEGRRLVLVTIHRRESFGAPLERMIDAVANIAATPNVAILWPVHPNPAVAARVNARLAGAPNIALVEPLSYPQLMTALERCAFVLTDSGGLQEEAPSFNKPVLVLRNVTERPEVIENGAAQLVGDDPGAILEAARRLLDDDEAYSRMARAGNPFGDGFASRRIVERLLQRLNA